MWGEARPGESPSLTIRLLANRNDETIKTTRKGSTRMNDYDSPPDYDYPETGTKVSTTTKKKWEPREPKVNLALIAPEEQTGTLKEIIMKGDLSKLTFEQRFDYANQLCALWKLDPLTKPFDWIDLDGKLTLYVNKGAMEQLRKIHGFSVTKIERVIEDLVCYVVAYGKDSSGREDVATGGVSLMNRYGERLKGDQYVNAILKAESRAKRRLTLSMGGFGLPSEDDIEDMKAVLEDVTPLEETAAIAEQIVEQAQESKQGLFKVGEEFKTGLEVHQFITDKIESIITINDLEAYLIWKKEHNTMLKSYCKDNMDVCMTYAEQVKEKEALIKVGMNDAAD